MPRRKNKKKSNVVDSNDDVVPPILKKKKNIVSKKKKKVVEPVVEEEEEIEEFEYEESDDDNDSDDDEMSDSYKNEDSEDEDEDDSDDSDDEGEDGILLNEDIVPIEKKSKKDKQPVKKQEEKGVIYLGRIPHGFYEKEMKGFFSQFGDVTRLRVSRNKKTGRSKNYAFIEFKSSEVADIVAETIDGYLMFNRILKCKRVPSQRIHPTLWKGANRKFKPRNKTRDKRKMNKKRSKRAIASLLTKEKLKREKLKELGIDYDFPGYEKASVANQEVNIIIGKNVDKNSVTKQKNIKKKVSSPAKSKKSPKKKQSSSPLVSKASPSTPKRKNKKKRKRSIN